jgi:tetratricopeptide (TPR) repeat protein
VQERINEISNIIAQQEYEASKSYNDAIEKGRQFYTEGDYRSAIVQYEIASSAKPLERLPKDMLLEINNILIERSKNNLALYNKLILVADEYYQSRVYDKALEEYEKSSAAYPGEQYPFKMINRIKKEMEERAIVDLVTNPFSLAAGLEKKFSFKSIEMRARKNNYILIKAKKTSEKPPKVFINYGVDSQKSGGIVMKGIDSNDTKEYLLRISIHDMWYRKDNNWISLYSEGGDIEIISLQISQGDIVNIQ